jgi:medium-chain acyl-[acyl-carrier-protein] hydrolase
MNDPSPWVAYRRASHATTWRLFCLPYAGGGASIYRSWAEHLPSTIDVVPVQLPGREGRLGEPPCDRLDKLVDSLTHALMPMMSGRVALFGYSMGALIAFELARALRRSGCAIDHLIVAAAPAPHVPRTCARLQELPDAALLDTLRELGGTPEAVLANHEIMAMLLPTFRVDFAILDEYQYKDEPPLACPVTAFGGASDPEVSAEQLGAWRATTAGRFESHTFAAGHFFVHSHEGALLRHVASAIDAELVSQRLPSSHRTHSSHRAPRHA